MLGFFGDAGDGTDAGSSLALDSLAPIDIPSVTITDPSTGQSASAILPAVSPASPPAGSGVSPSQWAQLFTAAVPAVVTGISQANLLAIQQQRAAAGLPPLDMSQYGLGVTVSSPQLQTALLVGGAFLVLMLMRKT